MEKDQYREYAQNLERDLKATLIDLKEIFTQNNSQQQSIDPQKFDKIEKSFMLMENRNVKTNFGNSLEQKYHQAQNEIKILQAENQDLVESLK